MKSKSLFSAFLILAVSAPSIAGEVGPYMGFNCEFPTYEKNAVPCRAFGIFRTKMPKEGGRGWQDRDMGKGPPRMMGEWGQMTDYLRIECGDRVNDPDNMHIYDDEMTVELATDRDDKDSQHDTRFVGESRGPTVAIVRMANLDWAYFEGKYRATIRFHYGSFRYDRNGECTVSDVIKPVQPLL